MSYQIVPRGKEGKEEEIKVVTAIPGSNGSGGFQLHFPCLSVHVLGPQDNHETEYYCITWSNYHERGCPEDAQHGENPGQFKIKRIEMKPDMIQVMDGNRKMVVKRAAFPGGIPHLDYCEMATRWQTHYDAKDGWTYGPNHPMERTEEILTDSATLNGIDSALKERFGEFGDEILCLFVNHDLFNEYCQQEMRQAA